MSQRVVLCSWHINLAFGAPWQVQHGDILQGGLISLDLLEAVNRNVSLNDDFNDH